MKFTVASIAQPANERETGMSDLELESRLAYGCSLQGGVGIKSIVMDMDRYF